MNSVILKKTMKPFFRDFNKSLIIDASGWGAENTGLKVFCEGILTEFTTNPPTKYAEIIVLLRPGAKFQHLKVNCAKNVYFETVNFRPIGIRKEMWCLKNVFRIARSDFLSLSSYLPFLLFARKKSCVIHDLKYIEIPNFLESKFKQIVLKLIMRWSIFHADKLFAVSEYTKSRISKLYRREDIVVTHEGIPLKFEEVDTKFSLPPKKYFLCVSELRPHKNLVRTIQAFIAANRSDDFSLVIIGRNIAKLETKFRSYVKSGTLILHDNIDDKQLGTLYQNAHAVLYMSLYEGFGLPILEAQKFGLPVLTANSSSTKEVAGSSCLLADPVNTADISKAILELMKSVELCDHLRAQGYKNIQRFSWQKASSILSEELTRVVV